MNFVGKTALSVVVLAALSLTGCMERSRETRPLPERGANRLTLAEEMRTEGKHTQRKDREWHDRVVREKLRKKEVNKILSDVNRRVIEEEKLGRTRKRKTMTRRLGLS